MVRDGYWIERADGRSGPVVDMIVFRETDINRRRDIGNDQKADMWDEMETDVTRLIRTTSPMKGNGVVGGVILWVWLGLWPVDRCIRICQTERG